MAGYRLDDLCRATILAGIYQGLIPIRITTCPPPKDGPAKTASTEWATAVWAKRHLECIEKLLDPDKDGPAPQQQQEGQRNAY